MADKDLIVNEEYIDWNSSDVAADLSELNDIVEQYVSILNDIVNTTIQEGSTNEALRVFIDYATQLKKVLFSVGLNYKIDLRNYNKDIDVADKYLF